MNMNSASSQQIDRPSRRFQIESREAMCEVVHVRVVALVTEVVVVTLATFPASAEH